VAFKMRPEASRRKRVSHNVFVAIEMRPSPANGSQSRRGIFCFRGLQARPFRTCVREQNAVVMSFRSLQARPCSRRCICRNIFVAFMRPSCREAVRNFVFVAFKEAVQDMRSRTKRSRYVFSWPSSEAR
jgi:hypothetical protein